MFPFEILENVYIMADIAILSILTERQLEGF